MIPVAGILMIRQEKKHETTPFRAKPRRDGVKYHTKPHNGVVSCFFSCRIIKIPATGFR